MHGGAYVYFAGGALQDGEWDESKCLQVLALESTVPQLWLLQREKWIEKHQYILPVIKTGSNGRRRSNKSYCGWSCCVWDPFFLLRPALVIGWALYEQEVAGLVLPSSQPGQPSGPGSAWPRWSASKGEGDVFIPRHFTRHVFKPN